MPTPIPSTIPDYVTAFGYDPLALSVPADPPEWPSGEATSYAYVDDTHPSATDTANTLGYPDKPRLTLPGAGTYIKIEVAGATHTSTTSFSRNFSGTVSDPCFIYSTVATAIETGQWNLNGATDVIMTGLLYTRSDGGCLAIKDNCLRVTVRDSEFAGRDVGFTGSTNSVLIKGTAANEATNIVLSNLSVHDHFSTGTSDFHGIKVDGYCQDVWIKDCVVYDNWGNGLQIGNGVIPADEEPVNIYVDGGFFYNTPGFTGETGFGLKEAQNIIINNVDIYGHYTVSGSNGSQITGTNSSGVKVYNCRIHNGGRGIAFEETQTSIEIKACTFYNFTEEDLNNDTAKEGPGFAIMCSGTVSGSIVIDDNLIYNCNGAIGISTPTDASTTVTNNKMTGRTSNPFSKYLAYAPNVVTSDNNIFGDDIRNLEASTISTTLADWQTLTGRDASSTLAGAWLEAYDGNGVRIPDADAVIQNFDPANWIQ